MNEAKIKSLLKDTDLAERWGFDDLAILHEVIKARGVPYLWLGQGEPNLNRMSWRCVRFRLSAIEKWEAGHEKELVAPTKGGADPVISAPAPGSDLIRGQRRRR